MLNKAQIEAAGRKPADTYAVPELGGDVGLLLMTAEELVEMRGWNFADDDAVAVTCKFLSRVLCDETGARLYGDDTSGMKKLPWAVMLRIAERARDLNLLTEASRERLKKSSETPPGSAGT